MTERLCILGVGLIGGSLALAARRGGRFQHITGFDPDEANRQRALHSGVLDSLQTTPQDAACGASMVVLAAPVGAFAALLDALKPDWDERTVYTDVGSTKTCVLDAARRAFDGQVPSNLVPGHPIAGRETSGVAAADAALFSGRRVILTPLPHTRADALNAVRALWQDAGAEVEEMDATRHDHLLAGTSHLPHVTAFALTCLLGRGPDGPDIFRYAAGGFRDFTRIASSDPDVWADICLANSDAIRQRLKDLAAELGEITHMINSGDRATLRARFAEANALRHRFLELSEPDHHA